MTGSLRRLCDTAVSSRCDAFYTDDGRGRRGASMNLAQAACVHARRRTGPPIPFPALVGTVTNCGSAARRIRIANWNKSNFTEPCKIYARSISIPPFEENDLLISRKEYSRNDYTCIDPDFAYSSKDVRKYSYRGVQIDLEFD